MKIHGLKFYIALSGGTFYVFALDGAQQRPATAEEVCLWARLEQATDNGPG